MVLLDIYNITDHQPSMFTRKLAILIKATLAAKSRILKPGAAFTLLQTTFHVQSRAYCPSSSPDFHIHPTFILSIPENYTDLKTPSLPTPRIAYTLAEKAFLRIQGKIMLAGTKKWNLAKFQYRSIPLISHHCAQVPSIPENYSNPALLSNFHNHLTTIQVESFECSCGSSAGHLL